MLNRRIEFENVFLNFVDPDIDLQYYLQFVEDELNEDEITANALSSDNWDYVKKNYY